MTASRLVMQEWSEVYQKIIKDSKVALHVHKGYVDDKLQGKELMRRGTRYNPKKRRFTWREDWKRIDEEEDAPDQKRMAEVCMEAMNSVSPKLTFNMENVHDFPNKRLVTLDMVIEVVENQISYSYYQKPMKTPW